MRKYIWKHVITYFSISVNSCCVFLSIVLVTHLTAFSSLLISCPMRTENRRKLSTGWIHPLHVIILQSRNIKNCISRVRKLAECLGKCYVNLKSGAQDIAIINCPLYAVSFILSSVFCYLSSVCLDYN